MSGSAYVMGVAIAFFLWTVRTGQYDDLEGPAHRILMDDDDPKIPQNARAKREADDAGDGAVDDQPGENRKED